MKAKKLALGTAQFGSHYGISNQTGLIPFDQAAAILDFASKNDITTLDTAVNYGTSQEVIGAYLAHNPAKFEIISKFPPNLTGNQFQDILSKSLRTLNIKKLTGYLAHDAKELHLESVRESLKRAKTLGIVQKIGVSVYYPEEVTSLLEKGIDLDIIQIPFNVLDQRFKSLITSLQTTNIEVHARSAFLQGLFFVDIDKLPKHFRSIKNRLQEIRRIANTFDTSIHELLLNYVTTQKGIDKIIIGVTRFQELQENLAAFENKNQSPFPYSTLDELAVNDERMILPFHWS